MMNDGINITYKIKIDCVIVIFRPLYLVSCFHIIISYTKTRKYSSRLLSIDLAETIPNV